MGKDPAVVATLIQGLNHSLLPNNLTMSSTAILVYDYLLNFHSEIQLIWFSPWNYTKILYLFIRYVPLAFIYVKIYVLFLSNTSVDGCRVAYPSLDLEILLVIIASEAVLIIRTWAVWRRARILGCVLFACFGAVTILGIVLVVKLLDSTTILSSPYLGFHGCYGTGGNPGPDLGAITYLALIALDAGLLVLMVISAYRTSKNGGANCKLSTVIHRDGVIYYVYILSISIVNVVLPYALPYRVYMMIYVLPVMYSVLTCRVILNVRGAAGQSAHCTSLHEFSEGDYTIPMQFAGNPQRSAAGDTEFTVSLGIDRENV